MIKLAPSILSADFGYLADQLQIAERAGAQLVHVDVMDGHFVPNITIGPVVVKAVRRNTSLPLDVHLMIENPEKYIEVFAKAGANIITIHLEVLTDAETRIGLIKNSGARAGIAVNPETPVDDLGELLNDIDMVTVMSVHPGFGGQSFIPGSLNKIAAVRRMIEHFNTNIELQVDGGVTVNNARNIIQAGANILVAGAAVFGQADIGAAVGRFLDIMASAKR